MVEKQLATDIPELADDTFRYFAETIERRYINRKSQFAKSKGRPALNFTQAQIEYAIANTKSNHAAAKFMGVQLNTYRKYAKAYGLYEGHLNPKGIGTLKGSHGYAIPIEDIFANKNPNYPTIQLKKRLIAEHILDERCEICGFNERRTADAQIPIVLDWKDGNQKNLARENLRFICYNHAMLTRGRINIKQVRFMEKQYKELKEERADIVHPKEFNDLFDRFNKKTVD